MKYLIVGLGNIGEEYANTRHNIGFIVLDALAKSLKAEYSIDRHTFIAKAKFKSRIFIMMKPTTYMNLSGKAVKYWMQKEKIAPENILIVVDDLAITTGSLRMKIKGGDGSHNGLASIIESLGTTDFPRLRIGIGDDFAKGYQSQYVLGKWTRKEEEIMIPKIDMAVEMIKSFSTLGIEKTMTFFNKK